MLIIIVIGLVVLTVGLIVAGLWSMQKEQVSRQPASRPVGPGLGLPSASSRLAPPPDLQWKRPNMVPWALTRRNAGLTISFGLGVILTLPILALPIMSLFWTGYRDPSAWSSLSPLACLFQLPFTCFPLLIPIMQVWMLIKGVKDWQKVKALEARGQLTRGVLLDRWSGLARGSQYCLAYYFELPWGSSPVIRAEVNKEAHRAYQVGDPVQVRYLPDKPQVCRLEI